MSFFALFLISHGFLLATAMVLSWKMHAIVLVLRRFGLSIMKLCQFYLWNCDHTFLSKYFIQRCEASLSDISLLRRFFHFGSIHRILIKHYLDFLFQQTKKWNEHNMWSTKKSHFIYSTHSFFIAREMTFTLIDLLSTRFQKWNSRFDLIFESIALSKESQYWMNMNIWIVTIKHDLHSKLNGCLSLWQRHFTPDDYISFGTTEHDIIVFYILGCSRVSISIENLNSTRWAFVALEKVNAECWSIMLLNSITVRVCVCLFIECELVYVWKCVFCSCLLDGILFSFFNTSSVNIYN